MLVQFGLKNLNVVYIIPKKECILAVCVKYNNKQYNIGIECIGYNEMGIQKE